MSTPDFLAQDDNTLTPIRFYTEFDPYYYTVDNRPLYDIEANIKAAREGGGDAARRAAIIGALNVAAVNAHLFTTPSNSRGISGLGVVQLNANTARILPGALYDSRAISQSNTEVVVKQALLTKNVDLTINAPINAGTSIVYTVEAEFVELDGVTMSTSDLPYVDAGNTYLPSTLINGELKLTLAAGTAATTGTEQPPVSTAGKIPLYNITIAQGATTFTVSRHDNAPYQKGLANRTRPVGAGTVANGVEHFALPDGSTTALSLPFSLNQAEVNPYAPIKVQFTFYPTVTGGNAVIRLRYKGLAAGELITAATTTTGLQVVPVTALANGVQTVTTTVTIPTKEFAGFVGGRWAINKEFLNIALERAGAEASDTATGELRVISVTLLQ